MNLFFTVLNWKLDDSWLLQLKHAVFWITVINCCVWMVCLTGMCSTAHTHNNFFVCVCVCVFDVRKCLCCCWH